MLLGIGGVRALRAFSRITGAPDPEVFHTNEGHAGFLGLERIRELIESTGLDFDGALEAARAGTIFTTHTPVPAGIDRFRRDLITQHFGGDNAEAGVPVDRVLALGAETYEGGDPSVFNMAVMGMRLAQRANGVAKLHGAVSRGMFAGLWPGFDNEDVPITSVTNGVHAPTWVAREVVELGGGEVGSSLTEEAQSWREHRAGQRRRHLESAQHPAGPVGHGGSPAAARVLDPPGASNAELGWTESALDPEVLTIGFARRVPSYKRLTLMLNDPARLRRLLLDPARPVQLIIAGKSHPADDGGKRLIQELVRFTDEADVRHRIVFLPNYDIAMAQALYPGCDVWLNNPLRPLEACGTSGMKAALNGGLNLSILDGWWDEMYDGQNGWAIPTADGVEDHERRDQLEANALYDLIEYKVAPMFYDRGSDGLPVRWLEMVRHTFQTLGPRCSPPGWCATTSTSSTPRRRWRPSAGRSRRCQRPRELEGARTPRLGLGARGPRRARRARRLPGGRLDAVPAGFRVARGARPVRRRRADRARPRRRGGPPRRGGGAIPAHAEAYEGGRHRFEGRVELSRTGAFGYTARILPRNPLLATPAELGLVVNAVPLTAAPEVALR